MLGTEGQQHQQQGQGQQSNPPLISKSDSELNTLKTLATLTSHLPLTHEKKLALETINDNNVHTIQNEEEEEEEEDSAYVDENGQEPITKLYIDGMNYSGRFFQGRDHWAVIDALNEITDFVESAKISGIELKIFIDADNFSKEAQKKWKQRREREVRKAERRSPQGMNVMLGEAFREQGIPVLYSWEMDNDDTLAAYAQAEGAAILSEDQDFFRYVGRTYRVFSDYTIDPETREIILTEVFKRKRVSRRPIAEILPKAPPIAPRLTANLYQRGTPDPMIKVSGNPHIKIRPLRQAFYARMNKTEPIKEIFPWWDKEKETVEWTDDNVPADSTYDYLLDDPTAAVKHFFPVEFEQQGEPPVEGMCKLEWANHVFACYATVFEMCSIATGRPLLEMLRPVSENWKMVMLFDCKLCKKPTGLSAAEISFYQSREHSLPKKCPECRAIRRAFPPKEESAVVDGNLNSSGPTETKKEKIEEVKEETKEETKEEGKENMDPKCNSVKSLDQHEPVTQQKNLNRRSRSKKCNLL